MEGAVLLHHDHDRIDRDLRAVPTPGRRLRGERTGAELTGRDALRSGGGKGDERAEARDHEDPQVHCSTSRAAAVPRRGVQPPRISPVWTMTTSRQVAQGKSRGGIDARGERTPARQPAASFAVPTGPAGTVTSIRVPRLCRAATR